MSNKNVKTLSPKIDVVFQALFGEKGNERITKGFLEKILNEKITTIDLDKNPILRKEFKDDKLGVLDILAELNGTERCNIELQIVDKKNIIERVLFYWSRLYSKQIQSGDDYKLLQKTIIILITDFELKETEKLDYHSIWQIMEIKSGEKIILTNKLEIDIIELPKIEGKEEVKDELLDWLYFLEDPKGERVTREMGKNKELKEAVEKLDGLSADERMQRIAELRQKAIMDEKATYDKGLDDGAEKRTIEMIRNMLEKHMQIEDICEISNLEKEELLKFIEKSKELKEAVEELEGMSKDEELRRLADLREKGRRDEYAGRQYAKKEGRLEEKTEIAKNMLMENVPIDMIIKITKLTKEEIERLDIDKK